MPGGQPARNPDPGETVEGMHGEKGPTQPEVIFSGSQTANDGYESPRPSESRKDLRLIQRAVRNGWPVPERLKEVAPQVLASILAAPSAEAKAAGGAMPEGPKKYAYSPRIRLGAIDRLLEMEKQNIVVDQDGGGGGGAAGGLTAAEMVRAVEERRRCRIVGDAEIQQIAAETMRRQGGNGQPVEAEPLEQDGTTVE